MVKKNFSIFVDGKTIKNDVKLLFSFDDLSKGDYEKVAWKVANVKYKQHVVQHVPIEWKSTIGFSLASKDDGHVVHPGKLVVMDPLQTNVKLVRGDNGEIDFKDDIEANATLKLDQISAENTAGRAASVAVGFVKNNQLIPTGYIGDLNNQSSWIITYKPDLTLWIASNGVTGQSLDAIAKSVKPIHIWKLADPTDTPDNSIWVLSLDDHATYQIKQYKS